MRPEERDIQEEARPAPAVPMGGANEERITNIVGQIDPQRILDNLNHALKGEYFAKEKGRWTKVGDSLINDAGRGWIISFFTSIMNNASTMGIIDETQFSNLMIGVIKTVTREFRCNLEKFGFVPPGKKYREKMKEYMDKGHPKKKARKLANEDMEDEEYENKGTPDTSRMNTIAEMIYQRAMIIYSRSLKGSESKRIFGSLNMNDRMGYEQQQQKSWFQRMMGR